MKGIGSLTAQVVFETSDRGALVLSGLRIATRGGPGRGERYRFDVGEGSFTMRAFLNTIRQAVYVMSFEPARTR
ncbi:MULTISPECIES: hypothetical protein [Curtobacterium]|uniref:hypothetical protein n=1 Tax=Curtobacterium TaxID=2034 RepID=UPI0015F77FBF|nr:MULTISPECIES: hypothetical protein [Curtobacterium]MCS6561833.1 hypothetical protein [Curtobacterium flaccumfaciens pv. poinsettiae]UXN28843.1 hypothetical protein N8D75_00580 [Curtobacterium flaccumfaciens]